MIEIVFVHQLFNLCSLKTGGGDHPAGWCVCVWGGGVGGDSQLPKGLCGGVGESQLPKGLCGGGGGIHSCPKGYVGGGGGGGVHSFPKGYVGGGGGGWGGGGGRFTVAQRVMWGRWGGFTVACPKSSVGKSTCLHLFPGVCLLLQEQGGMYTCWFCQKTLLSDTGCEHAPMFSWWWGGFILSGMWTLQDELALAAAVERDE